MSDTEFNHILTIGGKPIVVSKNYRFMAIYWMPADNNHRDVRLEFAVMSHGASRIRRLYRAARKGGASPAVARFDIYSLLSGSIYPGTGPAAGTQVKL